MFSIDAQDPETLPWLYASWRRRLLVGTLAATVVGFAIHSQAVEMHVDFAGESPSLAVWLVLATLVICALIQGLVGTGLAVAALGSWRRLRRSSKLARWTWILWVLGPLPVLLLPVSHILKLEGPDALKTSTNQALYLMTVTVPALFAILPGVLNASLVLERFLPESRAPGQITLLAAPACMLAYLLPLGVLAQFAFQFELYLGLLLLASSSIVPLVAVRGLLRRNTPKQAARLVATIGVFRFLLAGSGMLLIVIWIGEHPQLRDWIGHIDFVWVLGFVARILASKWLMTVVVTDVLVLMLYQGHESARALADKSEGELLGRKLDALGTSLRSTKPLTERTSA